MKKKSDSKRPYCPPQVRDYGKLKDITQKGPQNTVVDSGTNKT